MIDATLKNANILIIDDQEENIEVLKEFLELNGYTNVQSTTDPLISVRMFKMFKPDLILLDLMMPQLSGYEVMEQLKPFIPSDVYLPILILTADISKNAKRLALSDGAKDFLTKPIDLLEVELRIKNLLETRFLHQELTHKNRILESKIATIIKVISGWNE